MFYNKEPIVFCWFSIKKEEKLNRMLKEKIKYYNLDQYWDAQGNKSFFTGQISQLLSKHSDSELHRERESWEIYCRITSNDIRIEFIDINVVPLSLMTINSKIIGPINKEPNWYYKVKEPS